MLRGPDPEAGGPPGRPTGDRGLPQTGPLAHRATPQPFLAPPGAKINTLLGPICTGETYKSVVKLTFFKGASLKDPSGLFNSSLEGNTRRAIDFHEDDEIDEKAFAALIRAAVSLNRSSTHR